MRERAECAVIASIDLSESFRERLTKDRKQTGNSAQSYRKWTSILTDKIGSAQRTKIFNKPYRFYRKNDLDPRRLAAILTDKVDSDRDLRDNTLGNSY